MCGGLLGIMRLRAMVLGHRRPFGLAGLVGAWAFARAKAGGNPRAFRPFGLKGEEVLLGWRHGLSPVALGGDRCGLSALRSGFRKMLSHFRGRVSGEDARGKSNNDQIGRL